MFSRKKDARNLASAALRATSSRASSSERLAASIGWYVASVEAMVVGGGGTRTPVGNIYQDNPGILISLISFGTGMGWPKSGMGRECLIV